MRLAATLSALLWLVGTTSASAQDGTEEASDTTEAASSDEELAQAHFGTGKSYFDRGRYEDALTEFERAFELSGRVELQYNIYLAHERLGHLEQAIAALEQFMDEGHVDRPELRDRLEAMRERLDEERRAEAEQPGAPTAVEEERVEPDAEATLAPPTDGGGLPAAAVVSFVVAGVGLAAFGVFGGLALAEDSQLASDCGADVGARCSDDDLTSLHSLTLAADIGLGVAVLGAVVGVVLVLADGGDAEQAPRVSVHLSPTSASVRGAF